jgi:hypothetical protein
MREAFASRNIAALPSLTESWFVPEWTASSSPGYGFRQAIVGLVPHFQRFEFEQFGLGLILRRLCLIDLTQELGNGALEIVTPD